MKIKNILSWIREHTENEYVPHLLIRQFSVQNSLINEKQKVYLDSSLWILLFAFIFRSIIFANFIARDTKRLGATIDVEHSHVRLEEFCQCCMVWFDVKIYLPTPVKKLRYFTFKVIVFLRFFRFWGSTVKGYLNDVTRLSKAALGSSMYNCI